MPLYRYKCILCHKVKKFLTDNPPSAIPCDAHGATEQLVMAVRVVTPATIQNVEILDNGLAAKPIERYADAERLFTERAEKHTLEHKEENG